MMLQKLVYLLDKASPCYKETMCLLHTIEPVPTPFGQCQIGAVYISMEELRQ
jgi:hypothetical protein